MDHFQDITVLPDPEFPVTTLMNVLYSKLHFALVNLRSDDIAVCFPDHDVTRPSLGDRMRLISGAESLHRLAESGWFPILRDYTSVTGVNHVPERTQYMMVRRVQVKSSPDRLRRRLIRRKGISEEEAQMAIPDSFGKRLSLPFVTIKSRSSNQNFRLFIEHKGPRSEPVAGKFNSYGLSSEATSPWF